MTCRALPGVRTAIAAAAVLVSSGCASTATLSGDPDDSWELANRAFYAFNDAIDHAVLEPAAHLYLRLPPGLRDSVHNFFDNAAYPGTVLNFTREAYRQRRTILIHDGNPPLPGPGEDADDG